VSVGLCIMQNGWEFHVKLAPAHPSQEGESRARLQRELRMPFCHDAARVTERPDAGPSVRRYVGANSFAIRRSFSDCTRSGAASLP
jgi:hypothetical protein